MRRKPTVLLISTMDTKHQEAEFVMTCLKEADVDVYTIDNFNLVSRIFG